MEREYGEFDSEVGSFSSGIEKLGISEVEEDKAVENPTISIKQQQKRARNSSKVISQQTPLFQNKSNKSSKSQKTVFKSPSKQKEVVLLSNSSTK